MFGLNLGHYDQNPSVTLLKLQRACSQDSLAGTLYLQVFEGLLRHEFLLLVPFHSVHYTGPQKSNHCCFWKIIPFHFFFNIENHLHFTKIGVKRRTGRWGDPPPHCQSLPSWHMLSSSKAEENTMICSQSGFIFSSQINRLSSGQELLGNRK